MKIKNIIGFAWATTLLFSGVSASIFYTQKSEMIQEADAWNLDVTPSVEESYYSTCDGLTGTNLKSALANINKPKTKSYDWSRYEAADEAQDDSTSILCLYTRHNIKKSSHCGNYAWDKWNREHVYTQSAFPKSDDDNHNIFACEGQINNERGNKKFANVGGTPYVDLGHTTECYSSKNFFEPCDEAKGEVARACMYCTIYYGYTLPQIFDSLQTALDWHSEHPVTAREIYRNNVVHGLQGNRNPFIDHPSYANLIWGATYTEPDPLGGKTAPKVDVTGVTLNKSEITLNIGQSSTLTPTISPSNATNKNVTWQSGDTSVATVTDGVVKAIGEGTTTITVTTKDGGFTATCSVTVTNIVIPVTGVSLNKSSLELNIGQSSTLTATVTPSDAVNKDVEWSTNNNAVATVNNGTVTAVSEGQATITVTTSDGGFTATCSVTVKPNGGGEPPVLEDPLVGLDITKPSKLEYFVGEELDFTGFKARALYEYGNPKDVTNDVIIKSIDMSTVGTKTVEISYTEDEITVSGQFNIVVKEKANSKGGCHGSIIASSAMISITSLVGLSLLLVKKKK